MIAFLKKWFKDSETIFWARLQMLGGAIVAFLAMFDPSMFYGHVPPGWLPLYVVTSGIITEFARRLRDKDL